MAILQSSRRSKEKSRQGLMLVEAQVQTDTGTDTGADIV